MDVVGGFRFVCSRCSQTVEVNGAMMRALLEHGCVVCGGTVSNRAFAPRCGDPGDEDGERLRSRG